MAAARRAQVVAMVHNAIPHEPLPLQRPPTRWILSRRDRLVTHARGVADDVSELGVHVESVVVPHPPNIYVTPHPLPPDEELQPLFFGFVRPYKAFDIGLDALALLREQGFKPRLTVVGELWDGEPVAVSERRTEQLGLQDQAVVQPRDVPLVDVITHGVDGTLAARNDAGALAETILRCQSQLASMAAKPLENASTWADVAAAATQPSRSAVAT